jgi:hypothetical protein
VAAKVPATAVGQDRRPVARQRIGRHRRAPRRCPRRTRAQPSGCWARSPRRAQRHPSVSTMGRTQVDESGMRSNLSYVLLNWPRIEPITERIPDQIPLGKAQRLGREAYESPALPLSYSAIESQLTEHDPSQQPQEIQHITVEQHIPDLGRRRRAKTEREMLGSVSARALKPSDPWLASSRTIRRLQRSPRCSTAFVKLQ